MGLAALYAQVPKIDCKGHCATWCRGTIPLHREELERIRRALRNHDGRAWLGRLPEREALVFNPGAGLVPFSHQPECPLLRDGRCLAYQVRPMICRLFHCVEGNECEHGCRPERYLTATEAQRLFTLALGFSEAEAAKALELAPRWWMEQTWQRATELPEEPRQRSVVDP